MATKATTLLDIERLARERIDPDTWAYVVGAAGDGRGLRRNRSAFEEITINPRYLADVERRGLSTTVLGEKIDMPVMIAPAGHYREIHPEGDQGRRLCGDHTGALGRLRLHYRRGGRGRLRAALVPNLQLG